MRTPAAWELMWLVALGLYAAGKWASLAAGRNPGVTVARRAAYLLLFPGMNAGEFFGGVAGRRVERPGGATFVTNIFLGAALLWGLARAVPAGHPLVRGWIGMAGFVMLLHFGALQLVTLAWRQAGRDAPLLMNEPWRSKSLMEFWSERWNTAYRDLSHRFIYKPVARHFGPRMGMVAAFGVSGVVHDLVISVPAQGGYGLPTVYFLVQAAGVFFERSALGHRALGHGAGRRCFAVAVVVGPLGLLFHPLFVMRVFVPFMAAIGALPREAMR